MRKIVLTIALAVATLSTVTANNLPINETPSMHYAEVNTFCKLIREGNFDAVKAMIKNGENVNKMSTGLTPLMFAARYNRGKIAKLLIENGAKINKKSNSGFTALKWAKLAKASKTIAVLKNAMEK